MPLQRCHQGFPSFPSFYLCGPVSSKSKSTEVSGSLLFLPVARGKNFFFCDGKTKELEIEVTDFKCMRFLSYEPGVSKAETPSSFQCPLKTLKKFLKKRALHLFFRFLTPAHQ